jgi:hypothetical protein
MPIQHTYRPLRYYLITFGATFALWGVGAYMSHRDDLKHLHMIPMLMGLVVPFVVSLWMTLASGDPAMQQDLKRRVFDPTLMRLRLLPALLLLMPITVLVSVGISVALGGSPEQLRLSEGFSFSSGFVPVLVLLLLAAVFEELGWRGYAFDSLQSRFNLFWSSLLFGVLWSAWHLPLIFVKESYQSEILRENPWFAVNFFVSIVPLGFIISWFCIKNRKSVLAAILFHFVVNLSQEGLDMTQVTKCIETGVIAVMVVVLVFADRRLFFGRRELDGPTACEEVA